MKMRNPWHRLWMSFRNNVEQNRPDKRAYYKVPFKFFKIFIYLVASRVTCGIFIAAHRLLSSCGRWLQSTHAQ